MDWSKAKSWLIVLFAALNVFLIIMLVSAVRHSSTVDKNTILKTVSVLKENGIEVTASQIPDKIPRLNSVEVKNAVSSKEEFALRVLKDGFEKQGANRYVSKTKTKTLSFEQSKFIYADFAPSDNGLNITKKTAPSAAISFLNEIGITTDSAVYETVLTDSGFCVNFSQKLDKYPLFDSHIEVKLSEKGVLSAEGNWFVPSYDQDNVKSAASRVSSAASAAIEFISNEQRIKNGSDKISEISLGYAAGDEEEYRALATAVPVWQIKTTDGNVYYFDAH